jgi:hypothetical protein
MMVGNAGQRMGFGLDFAYIPFEELRWYSPQTGQKCTVQTSLVVFPRSCAVNLKAARGASGPQSEQRLSIAISRELGDSLHPSGAFCQSVG